jgi:DMSO reductase anchor subunit
MWRAAFGLGTSWISREIVAFGLFFIAASVWALVGTPQWLAWAALGFGMASVVAMDMVYAIRGSRVRAIPHSAMTTLTVALYTAFLVHSVWVLVSVAVVKAVLYLAPHRPHGPVFWTILRIAFLMVPSAGAAVPTLGLSAPVLLVALVIGELMDRAELYAGLNFVTPQRQIDDDFNAAASSSAGCSTSRPARS